MCMIIDMPEGSVLGENMLLMLSLHDGLYYTPWVHVVYINYVVDSQTQLPRAIQGEGKGF